MKLSVVHRHLFHSKNICPPPLPYFMVNICPFPLPHFGSMFFAYLWSFCWPNYIVTFPRYFSFRLSHLNIPTRPPSDELKQEYSANVAFSTFKSFRTGWIFSRIVTVTKDYLFVHTELFMLFHWQSKVVGLVDSSRLSFLFIWSKLFSSWI